jgi:acetoin utilization deacetylase AcuC-like enzyme
VKIAYSPRYGIDLGAHVFPVAKFARTRDMLLDQGIAVAADFVEPEPATWQQLALVHSEEYLGKARAGTFQPSELALMELPWSAGAVEGFRLMAGGTLAAARWALAARGREAGPQPPGLRPLAVSANLSGGFHHAFPDHGEGFCLFNDVAVTIRVLQQEGAIRRVAVVDCDVHHGNGTAATFEGDSAVFTFSIHQEHNYPSVKPRGSLDVGLPDGADDFEYLRALESKLPAVLAFQPDLMVYVAGADPFVGDQLGGLNLTFEGLRGRDYFVLSAARDAGIPVAIVLAGGYARSLDDTAAIHAATIAEAARLER